MKNFSKQKLNIFILIFLTNLFYYFPNIISQTKIYKNKEEPVAKETIDIKPKLKILDAVYGILDNKIRSGEAVALKNTFYKQWLEREKDGKDKAIIKNSLLDKTRAIFYILLVGKPHGQVITNNSSIRFKYKKSYLGARKRKFHYGIAKKSSDAYFYKGETLAVERKTSWKIKSDHPNIVSGSKIYLKSNNPETELTYLEKYKRGAIQARARQNKPTEKAKFIIYRIDSKKNIVSDLIDLKAYQTRTKGKEKLKDILAPYIDQNTSKLEWKKSLGKWEWNKYFGNPAKYLFKQMKITYQLDRQPPVTKIFEQSVGKINFPTTEEIKNAKREIKARIETKNNLESVGFVQAPGYPKQRYLKQLSVCGNHVVGIDNQNKIYKWDGNIKSWKRIAKRNFKKLTVSINGILFGLGDDNKIYKLIKRKPKKLAKGKRGRTRLINWQKISEDKFQDISLTNMANFWAIATDGKVFKRDETGKWIQVGQKTGLSKISTATDGTTYGLTKDGKILRWIGKTDYKDDKGWLEISGPKLKKISVGSEKYIWGIGEFGKTYRWTGEEWEEELQGIPVEQITVNSAGEVWLLAKETPPHPAGNPIYYKERNVWKFSDSIALLSSYYQNYLSINEDGKVNAETQWAGETEKFIILNPENKDDTGPVNYQQPLVLTSDYFKTNLNIKAGNVVAEKATLKNAERWKFIKQIARKKIDITQKGEIVKGTRTITPIALQSSDGKYLGTNEAGQVYLIENPIPGTQWQIE